MGVPAFGQNVIYIGDVVGGNHRSEARMVASLNGGQDLLVVGGSESEAGFELTTFTTGDEANPPELFIHPEAPGSIRGSLFRTISDMTPDGQWIAGRTYDETSQVRAFISGPFGDNFSWLAHSPNATLSRATGISDDGSVIVGQIYDSVEGRRAVYWDANRDLHFLPLVPGHESFIWAYDVSADGSVIIGWAEQWDETFATISQASFVWTEAQGIRLLQSELGGTETLVISEDGTLAGGRIYGAERSYPVYFTLADLQPTVLPVPPGYEGGQVDSFSADGTMASGYLVDSDESEGPVFTGVMWDLVQDGQPIFFQSWAMQQGCSFNGAHVQAVSIHSGGETYYGEVLFPETGAIEGFVVQIDPTPTDLTIVGRLPYPENRAQTGVGEQVFLRDIDPQGRLGVGQGNFHEGANSIPLPAYWTPATGLREIPPLAENGNPDEWSGRFGRIYDVTTNGDRMVGQGFAPAGWGYGFVADSSGEQVELPVNEIFFPIEGEIIREQSRAFAISDDGNIVVGQANARGRLTPNRAAYWDGFSEGQLLSSDVGETVLLSWASDISGNGAVINGFGIISQPDLPNGYAWRSLVWDDFVPRLLPIPEGYTQADTFFMSHDGSVSSGGVFNFDENTQPIGRKAIIWNLEDDSFELLDTPQEWVSPNLAQPNFDGSIMTGQATVAGELLTFVWDRSRGVFEVKEYLESVCGYNVGPYEIAIAQMNDEGTHIAGQAEGKYGKFAFFVALPEELVPAAARYLWRLAPPRNDAYKFIDWFGWLADSGTYPWVWHIEHGWIYTQGSDPESFLMFDGNLQTWWLIDKDSYPWMYKLGANSGWYYYYAPFGTPGQRFFYNPATGQSGLEAVIFP
jgi:uncharacterized membrane protein